MNEFSFKLFALISFVSGILVLAAVLFPILFYERLSSQNYPSLLSPIIEDEELKDTDYTRASNWFVGGAERKDFMSSNISFFTLSIPKLGIEEAAVAIGGEDLSKSLIQYPGTALPGKLGNTVIFGHSILPLFYNPKDYLAIFSTLPKLTKGDEVYLDYDGITYNYRVEDMFEVMPEDIEVLDQNPGNSYLSLITCVPPGHPLKPKRLVVRAKIVPPDQANANIGN